MCSTCIIAIFVSYDIKLIALSDLELIRNNLKKKEILYASGVMKLIWDETNNIDNNSHKPLNQKRLNESKQKEENYSTF